jgi:hypothetical protein
MQYVMRIHSLITLQIVSENVSLEMLEENVKLLDLIYRINKLKPIED